MLPFILLIKFEKRQQGSHINSSRPSKQRNCGKVWCFLTSESRRCTTAKTSFAPLFCFFCLFPTPPPPPPPLFFFLFSYFPSSLPCFQAFSGCLALVYHFYFCICSFTLLFPPLLCTAADKATLPFSTPLLYSDSEHCEFFHPHTPDLFYVWPVFGAVVPIVSTSSRQRVI